jgi:phospholipid-binding lipoprotein MlaA
LRARNIETLDEIEQTSLDYYASVRSLYRQSRNNEINNGAATVEDLPDF